MREHDTNNNCSIYNWVCSWKNMEKKCKKIRN